jgi:hypothetical protein
MSTAKAATTVGAFMPSMATAASAVTPKKLLGAA